MAVDVAIPGMGESVSEVVLIEWLKEDGEYVERDEPICVLETDKANVDLPAPCAGMLKHLQALEATLQVGAVIAQIAEGVAPALGGGEEAGDALAESTEAAPVVETAAAPAVEPTLEGKSDVLSPAVRRLVEEHGLDPAAIAGTGKDGRLTKKDVQAHLQQRASAQPSAKETPKAEPLVKEAALESPTKLVSERTDESDPSAHCAASGRCAAQCGDVDDFQRSRPKRRDAVARQIQGALCRGARRVVGTDVIFLARGGVGAGRISGGQRADRGH